MNGLHEVQFLTILLHHFDASIYYFMFNMFIDVPTRTSAALSALSVDLLAQKVIATFTNGSIYEYGNVSKRAIANVLFNPDVSLGFWINNNCIHADRTKTLWSYSNGNQYTYKEPQLPSFV
jgi:hypothetical protein